MAVDRALLQQLIDEIPFTKAEDKTYFTNALLADDAAATQFIGQRLRHNDYTKKTTDLATKEKDLATRATQSVQSYAQQLNEAQAKIGQIMTELENERVTTARAKTLLQKVKTFYNLTDEDIPKIDNDPGTGSGATKPAAPAIDIDAKLREFEQSLLTKLQPINSFPYIPVLVNEMQYEHQQLTGQRLSEAEIRELMAESTKENGPSLKQAWEQKHGIAEKRKAAEREQWRKEERQKWEDEQKAAASEAALRQVTRGPDGKFQSQSPVIGRKYNEHVDSTNKDDIAARDAAGKESGPKLSGAERAAQKYLERRAQGIPLGQEAPVGQKQ